MTPPPNQPQIQRFRWGLLGLFFLALALRFWRLGQIDELVFDEVYYVRFAVDYLHQTSFVDAHPPLGKYLIALGIALLNPLTEKLGLTGNTLAGAWLSPMSYRWMTALAGACLPPLTALLAYFLGLGYPARQRLTFGLLAGGLMLLDGLTLVESRFGLINIYWVVFGLLGQVCLLVAQQAEQRGYWQTAAGIAFGCAIAVKWNGAGFLLGVYLLWGISRWRKRSIIKPGVPQRTRSLAPVQKALPNSNHLIKYPSAVIPPIEQLTLAQLLIYCGLIPLVVYGLIWLPHLKLAGTSFVAIHELLWQIHKEIGEKMNAHPYCSAWYTWPLLLRPVAYFYRVVGNTPPATIAGAIPNTIYTVQGLGNPVLWWLSTAAIAALWGQTLTRWYKKATQSVASRYSVPPKSEPIAVFLLVNYCANWLPWLLIHRCTFLYLYMGSLVFSIIAIAWLLTRWFTSARRTFRWPALILLGLIVLSFLFWLPLYLGLPLSSQELGWRWWLPSWI